MSQPTTNSVSRVSSVDMIRGAVMILMAGLVKLPPKVVGLIGIVIIGGHNLLDSSLWQLSESLGDDAGSALWKIIYVGFYAGPISLGADGPNLIVLYSIIPWIGVMAAGYAFGNILILDPIKRNRYSLAIGFGAIALFVIMRGFNLYGDPIAWGPPSEYSKLPSFLSS